MEKSVGLRVLLGAVMCLSSAGTVFGAALPAEHKVLAVQGDTLVLDGKPFKILSGEMHYARIPREYWRARMKMAKAMGLNTIATYVFWNVHEPQPGVYDFAGNNDVAAFIRMAQEEGLYVLLRTGPYSCAEWDLGGLPAWLLKDEKTAMAIRSNDAAFTMPADRWIRRLAKELAPLQSGNGGPILMTQIENEYGNYGADHAYMAHLKETFVDAGFTQSLLYSADNWRNIDKGMLDGLFAATNFGISNHKGGMDALEKLRPGAPLFVSEYWPGWFDHWGQAHETRPTPPQIEDLKYILDRGVGINIYMMHGGTSFGFMAGSSFLDNHFLPDVTSYDYDAPLDESGRVTPKFMEYRKTLAKYSACGDESCLPAVPEVAKTISVPEIALRDSSPLSANLPAGIASETVAPMERFDQSYGYILYRTQLPAAADGDLVLEQVHDFAAVFVDGKRVGMLDRRAAQTTVHVTTAGAAQLEILVANDGRINSTRAMRFEQKGITKSVTLAGKTLTGWTVYPLPMEKAPSDFRAKFKLRPETPVFRHATFTLGSTGDTFLDISQLGKGAVWINGHNVGRFWNVGPQQTLYVPGPWLRKGRNEIVVFEMMPTDKPASLRGLDHPILNGPTKAPAQGEKQ